MKKILFGLALPLVGTLIALAGIELLYRLVLLVSPASRPWNDRPRFYYRPVGAPDMQDYPRRVPKPGGLYRIAVVGDSFTFGPMLQIDDTYPKKLQVLLNQHEDARRVEVLNYGVSGASTRNEIETVKQALLDGADFVLLDITLNDAETENLKAGAESGLARFGAFRPSPLQKKIFTWWKSLGYVVQRLHNTRTHREYKKYFFDLFENPQSWGVFSDSLKKIGELCRARNVPLGAVIFPLFGLPIDNNYPFGPIHAKVQGALKGLNIPFFDLFPAFLDIPALRLHIVPGKDAHPNEVGHRIAAEEIYIWLIRSGLIPQEFRVRFRARQRENLKEKLIPQKKVFENRSLEHAEHKKKPKRAA